MKSILPRRIRLVAGMILGSLEAGPDAWQQQWNQHLDTLRKGGSLEPDPGLVGDKQYIEKCISDYFGSFDSLRGLGAGCGTGRIEAWLAAEGAEVVCLDHFVEALHVSRIHAQGMHCTEHYAVGDLERMPFKERTFDFIYSGGGLEHFENPTKTLQEYFRVTKPSGVIIVSVPNLVGVNAVFGVKPLVELVLGRSRRSGYIEQDFSARSFRKVIEGSGFRGLNICPTFFNTFDYFPFCYLRQVLSLLRIYRLYCKLLEAFGQRFPGIAFGYSFMIALAQRPER